MFEKYLDDRVIIPKSIKEMPLKELEKEIERLEKEHEKTGSKNSSGKVKQLDLALTFL